MFKIDRLSVAGSYANMQAVPLLKDGSYAAPAYVPDIAFNFCLKKAASGWAVIADLSRSDAPGRADAASIRRQLPEDFPLSVFSATWRKLLAEY